MILFWLCGALAAVAIVWLCIELIGERNENRLLRMALEAQDKELRE